MLKQARLSDAELHALLHAVNVLRDDDAGNASLTNAATRGIRRLILEMGYHWHMEDGHVRIKSDAKKKA